MPRPKKEGGAMSGAERAQRARDKRREKDEAAFLKKQKEDRAASRLALDARLSEKEKEDRRTVANQQVSITCPHYFFLLVLL